MKIVKVIFMTFLLPLMALGAPFANEWNFSGEKVHSPAKKIIETSNSRVITSEFNRDGKLIKNTYQVTGNRSGFNIIAYNADGTISSVSSFLNGKLRASAIERGRYAAGKLIEIKRTGENPMTSSLILLHPTGQIKQITIQNGNDTLDFGYSFDEKGNLKSVYRQENGRLSESARYQCDNFGDFILAERYNSKGENVGIITNAYVRDSRGNWTKRTLSFGPKEGPAKETETITRSIEYY